MSEISVFANSLIDNQTIPLIGSKSESNRALIINALSDSPGKISNLATARDTEIMSRLLSSRDKQYDAMDAGTVMRFMTAFLAISKEKALITGTDRMKQRPIYVLVDALRELGCQIKYLEEVGYPPLEIKGFSQQLTNKLRVKGNISSQYISALLMIAPTLPKGLTIEIEGELVSQPYINLTVSIMQHFGVKVNVNGQLYSIARQAYHYQPYSVEADWSGASYWYSIFVLSNLSTLAISGLKPNSVQGDTILKELMQDFGVITEFKDNTAILTKSKMNLPRQIDFIKCPDLAQTFAVLCAAMGHECTFFGLQTLKIKETNRVAALKTELLKFGADFIENTDSWIVKPIPKSNLTQDKHYHINTFEDHRMAMAFAALAVRTRLSIDNREVVNKSYPSFWDDLRSIGFIID